MIELKNISYKYPDGIMVLNDFNFTFSQGDRLGLIGPNGSGKTTLFKLIMGLLAPDEGDIIIFGQKREKQEDYIEVREKIGLLFQDVDDQLFNPTVEEEVAFGPLNLGKSHQEAREIVKETLKLLGMQGFEKRITYHLSGGEKKMIAIAAVLAMEPRILLLDEPFSGLDRKTTGKMVDILNNRISQSFIIVSHNEELLQRVTDRINYM